MLILATIISSSMWGAVNGDVFTRISSVSDLAAGDEIIIVNQAETHALSTTQNSNNRGRASITVSSHSYTYNTSHGVQVLTVSINSGKYSFHTGTGYLRCPSNNNYLRTYNTLENSTKWSLSVSSYVFTISNEAYTSRYIAYNSSSSIFSCYASGQEKPYIFKKQASYTVGWSIDPAVGGTLSSTSGLSTTVTLTDGYRYASTAYTVLTGAASVSQSTNTFTATPTKNSTIQINVEQIPTHTIHFNTGGLVPIADATGIREGNTYIITQDPSASLSDDCEYNTFVGWTTASSIADPSISPSIITSYTMSTSDVTLYAVYSKTEGSGGGEPTAYSVGDVGDYVLAALNKNDSKWYAIPTGPTVTGGKINGVEITVNETAGEVKYVTTSNATGYTWTIAKSGNYYTISDGTNYLYHSNGGASGTDITYGSSTDYPWSITNDNGLVFAGVVASSGTVGNRGLLYQDNYSSNPQVFNKFGGYSLSNKDGNGFSRIQVLPIGEGGTTTYSMDAGCCDNIVAAPTVSATNIHYNQFTLSWTNVTGADSYNVTCTGGTPGAIQSDGTTRTCTITGLASPNTSYSWTVVATYSGSYCGATPAAGSTITAQVYAVTYNANDGTVTTLPASASYEAGVTVTVAAKPATTTKSGCTFTGWNTQNDGQGTHYDADGTKTFTMPSAAVTLYAEWTKKKNYYVDRMHGTNDGHTVTIGGVVYNCYLREGANYTVPTISDNTSGASACHSEHDHLLFWVTESSVNDDGTLKGGYTEVTPGDTKTAQSDGTVYYAIWGKLAD